MSASFLLLVILGYFLILFLISFLTGKNSSDDTFFKGNRSSPWYLVAFGMIGASLSGVTFISVPGWVGNSSFSYMQMVLGYLLGYAVIAFVLMPLYYRLNLTSIYGYLERRFGFWSYKTGAFFFLLSRSVGAAARLYLVAMVLDGYVFGPLGIDFIWTVIISIGLIWLYTFRGGIKTVVWTDTLQTLFMLLAAGIAVIAVKDKLGLDFNEMIAQISESDFSKTFVWDSAAGNYFWKQFFSGAFIAIVMTGLDQDMMQKNLTIKSLKDAQLNMVSFSIVLVFVNLVFLALGVMLYQYGLNEGIVAQEVGANGELTGKLLLGGSDFSLEGARGTDELFPFLAIYALPPVVSLFFILGLIAAAYSSADSALTSLTTSFCVDFLGFEDKDKTFSRSKRQIRNFVHLGFSILIFILILLFYRFADKAVIALIFQIAGYTYGPLLGMYAFGLFTRLQVLDKWVPLVCLISPFLAFGFDKLTDGWMGFLLILVNGGATFLGMLVLALIRKQRQPADSVASTGG